MSGKSPSVPLHFLTQIKTAFFLLCHSQQHTRSGIEKPELIEKYNRKKGAQKNGVLNPRQGAMLETLDQSFGS